MVSKKKVMKTRVHVKATGAVNVFAASLPMTDTDMLHYMFGQIALQYNKKVTPELSSKKKILSKALGKNL